jgi:predicted neuraminidase
MAKAVLAATNVGILAVLAVPAAGDEDTKLKTELTEFVFEAVPFRECHASSIVDLPNGDLLAAWFGGKHEGDNSVEIWLSRKPVGGTWSPPQAVTNFPDTPCWNPVLFRDAQNQVWLFFKIGPDPTSWVGAYRTSTDGGKGWSDTTYLPAGLLGPIRNKPILLSNGDILAGTSREAGLRNEGGRVAPYWSWASWVERSPDGGKTWSIYGPIVYPGKNFGVIQPTLWESEPGHVRMLLRSTEQIGAICESASSDGGQTWTPARATSLPNPNSGIDAVKMKDGRIALVYNHTRRGRTPLNLAASADNGKTWGYPTVLEDQPGEYSYPAIIQASDGKLHITYTWRRRRIKHVVVNPLDLGM